MTRCTGNRGTVLDEQSIHLQKNMRQRHMRKDNLDDGKGGNSASVLNEWDTLGVDCILMFCVLEKMLLASCQHRIRIVPFIYTILVHMQ